MRLTFYERVGFEGRRPSPFSWRIRYALAHKGIDFDVQPVRFADVETIRRLSGQHLTPVIDDNGKVTHETWDIANYLEDRFPDRPSLFGGAAGKGMARFINLWSDMQLGPPLRRVIYAVYARARSRHVFGGRVCRSGEQAHGFSTGLCPDRAHACRSALLLRELSCLCRLHCLFGFPDGAPRLPERSRCERIGPSRLAHANDLALRWAWRSVPGLSKVRGATSDGQIIS